MFFLSFLSRGTSRDGTGQAVKIPSRPVPWQNFELVPLSLCPGTRKKCLSSCPEKLRCPVPLETLLPTTYLVLLSNVPFLGLSWTPLPTQIWDVIIECSLTDKKNQIDFWSGVKVVKIECKHEIQILKGLYLGVTMIDSIKSYPRSLFCRSIQSIVLLHNIIDFVNP